MIAAAMETLAEALVLLRKSGVDGGQFLDVMTRSLFASPIYQNYGKLILNQSFEPAGFKLKLGLKDVKLALAAAEAVSAPLPVASLVRDHLLSGIARGYSELDWSALGRVVAENAGTS
jgi:3-hydroxyisobutyrate dehydrogenase-like beta-hydroxyacid dehydrogenase